MQVSFANGNVVPNQRIGIKTLFQGAGDAAFAGGHPRGTAMESRDVRGHARTVRSDTRAIALNTIAPIIPVSILLWQRNFTVPIANPMPSARRLAAKATTILKQSLLSAIARYL